jgi:S1-C subfamily serine protease
MRVGCSKMSTVRASRRQNRLKRIVAALCMTALAAGPWTLAVAQNHAGGSSAPEEAVPLGDAASYKAGDPMLDADDVATSWLGLTLSRDHRKLKSGEYVNGLLVVDVDPGSPAARAGLQPPSEGAMRTVAEMASLAAGMVFPPAMIVVPLISSTKLDESYDMIIGVDGDRVVNVLDVEDHLRLVEPGEVVYLNVVRNGSRQQVPVYIPLDTSTQSKCGSLPCWLTP